LQAIVTEVIVDAGLTVIAGLVPVTGPEVAVNVTVPAATPVATPDPEIVAMLAFDELHVTELVRVLVLPSEYVPMAVIWSVCPTVMDGTAAVTAMEFKVGGGVVTVTVGLVPVIDPEVAVNVTVPAATPVATPEAETVATPVLDELHVTEFVRFLVLPSE
jgi:fructose-bisphosphate aldolase class 1